MPTEQMPTDTSLNAIQTDLDSRPAGRLIYFQVVGIFSVMILSVAALIYFLPESKQAPVITHVVEPSEGNGNLDLSFMHKSSTLLILVVIVAGCLGGLANFLTSDRKALKKNDTPTVCLWQCMILSMSASACVPLFLNIIQSDLIKKTPYDSNTYFSFLGFCILAAFTSKRFIDTLAERALKTANEAKDIVEKTNESVNKITETQSHLEATIDQNSGEIPVDTQGVVEKVEGLTLNEKTTKVLDAVEHSRFTFRTTKGIASDCNLTQDEVNGCLSWLMKNKLVNQSKRSKGWRWYITATGRAYLGLEAKGPTNLFSE